jgi:hypothetical protein
VEGKTGNQGGTKRLQMKLSERGNEKTQPAGWVFFGRTAESSGLPSENVGFRSTGTRRHASGLAGGAAVVLEVGELH